jgi:8-amino-7-oxononanoate synthase
MHMTALEDWLTAAAGARYCAGLTRTLQQRPAGQFVNLASNDYLGLAHDPRVVEAAIAATRTWGTGATGSRLVTGTTGLHVHFEADLADFVGAEAGLVFSSGYAANIGVLQALASNDTLIVSDAGNHASLIDGCRLSPASVLVTRHRDPADVEQRLAARRHEIAIVVTDAVFSVDGDLAPLRALHEVCHRHGATLIVDEAHAFGVVGKGGRGAVEAAGLAGEPDIVQMVTLSKALGGQGGAVLGSRMVIDQLVNTARTFIFDTALAPGCVAAAAAALSVLRDDEELPGRALRRARQLARELKLTEPVAAVIAVPVADPALARAAADECFRRGVLVGCFRPPSVPSGASRLRLTARADLDEEELQRAVRVIEAALACGG